MSPELIIERVKVSIEDAQVIISGADCNFSIQVVSKSFMGKSPLQSHRMVNDLFKEEFKNGSLHALSIKTTIPELE
jgi:stress-induced morphogen